MYHSKSIQFKLLLLHYLTKSEYERYNNLLSSSALLSIFFMIASGKLKDDARDKLYNNYNEIKNNIFDLSNPYRNDLEKKDTEKEEKAKDEVRTKFFNKLNDNAENKPFKNLSEILDSLNKVIGNSENADS